MKPKGLFFKWFTYDRVYQCVSPNIVLQGHRPPAVPVDLVLLFPQHTRWNLGEGKGLGLRFAIELLMTVQYIYIYMQSASFMSHAGIQRKYTYNHAYTCICVEILHILFTFCIIESYCYISGRPVHLSVHPYADACIHQSINTCTHPHTEAQTHTHTHTMCRQQSIL